MTITITVRGETMAEAAEQAALVATELELCGKTSLQWDNPKPGYEFAGRWDHVDGQGWSREWVVEPKPAAAATQCPAFVPGEKQ